MILKNVDWNNIIEIVIEDISNSIIGFAIILFSIFCIFNLYNIRIKSGIIVSYYDLKF